MMQRLSLPASWRLRKRPTGDDLELSAMTPLSIAARSSPDAEAMLPETVPDRSPLPWHAASSDRRAMLFDRVDSRQYLCDNEEE